MISAHALEAASGLEALGHRLGETIATGRDASAAVPSDEVLVSRIARGEQAALRALMARHQVRISRFVRRFVSDRSVVEDLVCDTFFAAWQQAPHFENSIVGRHMADGHCALQGLVRPRASDPADRAARRGPCDDHCRDRTAAGRRGRTRRLGAVSPSMPGLAARRAGATDRARLLPRQVDQGGRAPDGNSREHGQVAHVPGTKEACRDAQRGRSRERFGLAGTGRSARPGRPGARACTTRQSAPAIPAARRLALA